MKKYLITLIIFLGFYGVSSALDPVKVAIVNPGATGVQIDAEIIDLDNPTPAVYGQAGQGTYDADDNGIISFRVGAGDPNWDAVSAAGIDGRWVLNIYTGGTMYAQYRLDKILFDQANGLLNLDDDGNLVPDDTTSQSLGSSEWRWKDIYVSGSSIHVGEHGNDATIGFDTGNNEMVFNVNGSDEVTVSQTIATFNGRIEQEIGGGNMAVGKDALVANTSGSLNTALGNLALNSNTSGNQSTAIGGGVLTNNTTGSANTAAGYQSLFNNDDGAFNTGFGNRTLMQNVSGNHNTAAGWNALRNSTSNNNTALGYEAGISMITGTDNVFIGYQAGQNASQLVSATNSIAIGEGTFTTSNNQVVLGNTSITETILRGTVTVGSTTIDESNGNTTIGGTFGLPTGTTVNEIVTAIGGTPTDDQLPTAAAVSNAITSFSLQDAYDGGGNTITTDGTNDIQFLQGTSENFDVQIPIVSTDDDIVLIDDNFRVNGTSDLRGTISNNGGIADPVTIDDAEGLTVNTGVVSATAGLDVTGANLDVGSGSFTVTTAGVVSGASATYTGTVEAGTLTEGGIDVPNENQSPAAGDISGDYANGLTIDAGAVGTDEIATDGVDSDEIAADAVGTAELATDAVTTIKITDANVTEAKLADGAVATAKIAADAVTSAKIATGAVGTDELASADYSGDLNTGNYVLGNLDNTVIGANTAAAGTFTSVTANNTTGGINDDALNISAGTLVLNQITGQNSNDNATNTAYNIIEVTTDGGSNSLGAAQDGTITIVANNSSGAISVEGANIPDGEARMFARVNGAWYVVGTGI